MFKQLFNKEVRLSSPICWVFLAFSVMVLIPSYPFLVAVFFICQGIFQSFIFARENNDVLYTVLLPVKKSDAVTAKYAFTALIEMLGLCLMAGFAVLRNTVLKDAAPYAENVMLRPNFTAFGWALLMFAAFNWFFLHGFFKTAYKVGVPFILFAVAGACCIAAAEFLCHIPGLQWMNAAPSEGLTLRLLFFAACLVVYLAVTALSLSLSKKRFEKIDIAG